jgi:hypothetical protein
VRVHNGPASEEYRSDAGKFYPTFIYRPAVGPPAVVAAQAIDFLAGNVKFISEKFLLSELDTTSVRQGFPDGH